MKSFWQNTAAKLRFFGGVAAALVFSGVAQAQGAGQLEEVVVTAQKREQSLQDVPISVSALSSEYLSKTNTKDFADVSRISPGVTLAGPADGQNSVIRIRGFGSGLFQGGRSAVRFFVDDVPLLRSDEAFTNLMDLERIEVLKGPQSTLFGKEALGGAISMITAKPDGENFEGHVEAQLASFERGDLLATLNLPLGGGIAWRISGSAKQTGGSQVDNIAGDSQNSESQALRSKLLLPLGGGFQATVSYDYYDGALDALNPETLAYGDLRLSDPAVFGANAAGSYLPADAFDGKVQFQNPVDRTTENERLVLRVQGDLSDSWSLTSVTGYQDWYQLSDLADTLGGLGSGFPVFSEAESQSFSQELRFHYTGEDIDNVYGLFYAETNQAGDTGFAGWLGRYVNLGQGTIPYAFLPNAVKSQIPNSYSQLSLNDISFADTGIFFHSTYHMNELWNLIYGMRYSWVKEINGAIRVGLGQLNPDTFMGGYRAALSDSRANHTPIEQSKTSNAFSGTVKLRRKLRENVSVYGGIDRGFKAGGYNTSVGTTPGDEFDSEFTTNYEVGFKGDFLNRSLRWNTAVFIQRYKDLQVSYTPVGQVLGVTGNAARAEVSGFETEFRWLLDQHITVDGNIAYVNSRYKDYTGAPCLRIQFARNNCTNTVPRGNPNYIQDLSDKRLSHVSPWTANLNVSYSDMLANGMHWYVRGEMAYRDDFFGLTDLDPGVRQDEYTLFNASFSLSSADRSWEAILWAKNLADEEYITHFIQSRDASSGAGAYVLPTTGLTTPSGATLTQPTEGLSGYVGEARSFGLSFKYYF